jgi:hypothetical protein
MAISAATTVENPLPVSKFRANITGLDPYVIINYKPPVSEVGKRDLRSGGQTIPVKHVGDHKGYEFSMTVIVPAAGDQRTFLWKKHKACLTRNKKEAAFDMSVTHLGPNDEPSIEYEHEAAQISKFELSELDSTKDSDNMTIKLELMCDNFDMVER